MSSKQKSDVSSLEKKLAFYRSYHHDTINVLLHCVFIPTILFTSTGILANVVIPSQYLPDVLLPYAKFVNLGTLIIGIGYTSYYLLLDLAAGLISTPIIFAFVYYNTVNLYTIPDYNAYILYGFVTGWVVQFIGHGVFEKRAPALLDNLLQALVLAPYFVIFEAMFLFGFRLDLHRKVDTIAEANIKAFRDGKKAD